MREAERSVLAVEYRGSATNGRPATRLGSKARVAIQYAAEVKAALRKLRTTRQLRQALADGGFHELPISFEHAEAISALPGHHNDPFDRLILAAAQVNGLTIVTSDRKFALYDVPLIDARQ